MSFAKKNEKAIKRLVQQALAEDKAAFDVTTKSLFAPGDVVSGVIIAKNDGIVAGLDIAALVFKTFDKKVKAAIAVKDGAKVKKGKVLMKLTGPARSILSCERTALNFLGHLSGVATLTGVFVKASGRGTIILDTRKTIPGLRLLQKYAVKCGGGVNYRNDLAEMAMIKDNHVAAFQRKNPGASPGEMVKRIRRRYPKKKIVVEVDGRRQLMDVLSARPDIVMFDNFTPHGIREGIKLAKKTCRANRYRLPEFEASGGISGGDIAEYAGSGVTRISLGAITHSAPNLDVSLEITG